MSTASNHAQILRDIRSGRPQIGASMTKLHSLMNVILFVSRQNAFHTNFHDYRTTEQKIVRSIPHEQNMHQQINVLNQTRKSKQSYTVKGIYTIHDSSQLIQGTD
jgi:hypothetical protein